ncbi:MAG: hypothetical protein ACR2HP_14330 [Ilumatobacteraceae bacterium]
MEDCDLRSAADGDEGRLVGVFHQEANWPTWERHPNGEEVVVLLSGRADLIQWLDGTERVIPLEPCHGVINPVGVWHTARVQEPGDVLFTKPVAGPRTCPWPTSRPPPMRRRPPVEEASFRTVIRGSPGPSRYWHCGRTAPVVWPP